MSKDLTTKTSSTPVKRRAVFFIGGYDPKSPEAFFDRMARENKRFEKLWKTEVEHTPPETILPDVTKTTYKSKSIAGDWEVQTEFNFLSLDDIVLKDFERPLWKRLMRYSATVGDYFVSGTAFAFFKHAWRFALYFLYPVVMLITALIISLAVAGVLAATAGSFGWLVGLGAGVGAFILLLKLIGSKTSVLHLMDLWSFSRDFLHGNRVDIREKLNRLADLIAETTSLEDHDEIILIGHSTGGALMLDAAARTADRHPEFKNSRAQIQVLTVGSTALKIGLHPKAKSFRLRIKNLFEDSNIGWVEYQCISDAINFYRTDPGALMQSGYSPIVRNIKMKNMLEAETYKRIKTNLFRVHYQFVFANTKPYHYDFPGICFGPASLQERAENSRDFRQSLTGKPVDTL